MKKAIAIALIGLMAISAIGMMPVKVKAEATGLQGYTIAAYGGDYTMNFYNDSVGYRGNITGCDVTTPSKGYPVSPKKSAKDFGDGIVAFAWSSDSAGGGPYSWAVNPSGGDTLALICEIPDHPLGNGTGYDPYSAKGSENGINYTWALFGPTHATNFWKEQADFMGRPEPIPGVNTTLTKVGGTWINVTIPHFKYTDYNYTLGGSSHRGTYEAWHSYAVFIKSDTDSNYTNWTYYNTTKGNISGPDSPIPAYGDSTDPSTIDTGYAYLNITGLLPNTNYWFKVRPDFIGKGGYGGGLGSYTTYGTSPVSDTDPKTTGNQPITTTPEFSTILIPIVAVIGMFMVATYAYRRKH